MYKRQLVGFIYLVKLMIARHGCLYLKMIEQLYGVSRSLRCDEVYLLKCAQHTECDVPVSYTHLDVYKRQNYRRNTTSEITVTIPEGAALNKLSLDTGVGAVSYTHLQRIY